MIVLAIAIMGGAGWHDIWGEVILRKNKHAHSLVCHGPFSCGVGLSAYPVHDLPLSTNTKS